MLMLALLWLAAPVTRVEPVNQIYEIPAADWAYIEISLKQLPVLLECQYAALNGAKDVRVELLSREDLRRARRGQPHGSLALTAPGERGELHHRVRAEGAYFVLIENRGKEPAKVQLRVALDFERVTYVSPQRRLAVILISFAVFFGIVTWSAKRLLAGQGVGRVGRVAGAAPPDAGGGDAGDAGLR